LPVNPREANTALKRRRKSTAGDDAHHLIAFNQRVARPQDASPDQLHTNLSSVSTRVIGKPGSTNECSIIQRNGPR
jgi:hypothetical protein